MSKLIDMTGQKFNELTVVSKAERIGGRTMWNCICDCGAEVKAEGWALRHGATKSCYRCSVEKATKNKIANLEGQRFGRWTVLEFAEIRKGNAYWKCRCDCGNEGIIAAHALKNGATKSCGCHQYIDKKRICNEFEVDKNNTVHVILRSGDEMLCDKDDWERLKEYTWNKDAWGYAVTHINRKVKKFHIEVMGEKQGYVIDHADRNKLNNQKSNLRFLTKSGNAINSKLPKNNTSGVKGVTKTKCGKWHAQLGIKGQNIHLGNYETIEEAAEARRKAERIYHKPLLEEKR